jgi:cytochrome c553
VSNYGQPDQNPGNFTAALAANKKDVRKTFAMEYSPIDGNPDPALPRVVKFYVFDGACTDATPGCNGVNSLRSVSADLDGSGEKYVPQLCNTCHGGNYAPVNPNDPTIDEVKMGANFLPLDIASYRDGTAGPKPSDPAFGTAGIFSQEAGFYAQNQMVLQTNPAPPIQNLIGLFYPTGSPPFDASATPCGWRQSTAGGVCGGTFSGGTGDAATETLYRSVIAKACRSCHIAQTSNNAWDTYRKLAVEQAFVRNTVCGNGVMPHSYIAFRNFWRSTAPNQPATLASFSQGSINADSPAWTAIGSCVLQ